LVLEGEVSSERGHFLVELHAIVTVLTMLVVRLAWWAGLVIGALIGTLWLVKTIWAWV
jgi:hypothetical protein